MAVAPPKAEAVAQATEPPPKGPGEEAKEQGNAQYKDSRFEDAANLYTRAIKEMPMSSCDLALNCYSNRAACFQQMREPKLALADVNHVLVYDPTNAKALARKQVYEQQVASER